MMLEKARGEQKITLQFNHLSLLECQDVILKKTANLFIKVPTAYEAKEEKVKKALEEAVKEIIKTTDAFDDSSYLGIEEFSESSINYIVNVHCPQDKRIPVKRASLSIIKRIYDENKIKIPYNQIEVHNAK